MDIKQKILHLYRVNEKSLREISRELGIDRKTVTRLVNAYEAAVKSNPETGIDEFLSMSPKYKSRIGVPRVLRGSISHEIDTLIAGMFGFEKCPYSEAEEGSSIAPEVKI